MMIMLRFLGKKVCGECKSQIFVIGDKNAGRGDRVVEACRRSVRHRDDFDWLRGHSTNQEAPEVSWWGSWLLPDLYVSVMTIKKYQ